VRTLDLALLQAGAGVKGEFENRLKGLIEEVKASPSPIVLFIDEAHTMIGAGGQAGQNDAANLLKPALARGELRTIAATTWSEYKKYFEKDAALARRFQVVKVDEPSEARCQVMLRGVIPALEKHHNVRILDEALVAAVRLSHRYLPDRQLPDKAVSVLDTACARLSLGQNTTPPAIEDAVRQLDDLQVQARVLGREAALGAAHEERLAGIAAERAKTESEHKDLQERWERERELIGQIRTVREQIESAGANRPAESAGAATAAQPAVDLDALRSRLAELNGQLDAAQGESPMMRVCVDSQIVGSVISAWTGIPVGKMLKDEVETVLALDDHLRKRVIGQDHALAAIGERIRTSKASLEDPGKPIGVFLLVGPSGVGKTETALALADLLYGGERNLITINMSEFQEAHTVSTLKGSPPGYVGYGEGGVLTEAVRRRPYSVVLLDEVEKAHPDVLELFFQVFDKGIMEDSEGREIDFRNTIILLTSNAATETFMKLTGDPQTAPLPEPLVKALKPELNRIFKPAFLGRLVIIPYYPVRDEALRKIVVLKLAKIQRRIQENHKIDLVCGDDVVREVARRCTEVESGARNVDNILTNTLLPAVSRRILSGIAQQEKLAAIQVAIAGDGSFVYS
jgi:type VI secretion system protein VasG